MHYPKKIVELTRKLLSGAISPEELEELNEWYDTNPLNEASLLETDNQKSTKEKVWSRLEKNMLVRQKQHFTIRLQPLLKIGVAAMIFAGLTLGFVYLSDSPHENMPVVNYVDKVNPEGKRSSFQLPDGSRVWLNAKSHLRYPLQFAENHRDIILKGEAYFEVVRNELQPFVVHAGKLTTTVLGTAFNVKSFPQGTTTVTVAEGKVQVAKQDTNDNTTPHGKEVTLTPNQQVVYDPNVQAFEKKEVNSALFLTWKEDALRFDEIPLKEVAIMIEQWYDVEVTLSDKALENCIILGKHSHESLENVLEAIRFALNIEYEINNQKVIIRGRGCE